MPTFFVVVAGVCFGIIAVWWGWYTEDKVLSAYKKGLGFARLVSDKVLLRGAISFTVMLAALTALSYWWGLQNITQMPTFSDRPDRPEPLIFVLVVVLIAGLNSIAGYQVGVFLRAKKSRRSV